MALEGLSPEESSRGRLWFPVWPIGQSRVTGSGLVTPGPGADYSTVLLQWEGLPPHSEHALSQHHGESCTHLDERPEYVFAPVVSDSQGKAAVTITPRKPFWRWWNRPHFLVLHWGAGPEVDPMACGSVVAPLEFRPEDAPPLEAAALQAALPRSHAERHHAVASPVRTLLDPRLTLRENEVLELVASGCTNAEIATSLTITLNTVERHITNLYAKINARNKADATAFAIRHGMGAESAVRR